MTPVILHFVSENGDLHFVRADDIVRLSVEAGIPMVYPRSGPPFDVLARVDDIGQKWANALRGFAPTTVSIGDGEPTQ